ncbi:MAG: glycosyltransferase family 1 protein [Candidatus Levybacteria bacterium]|nr:glycosyltransferase family 1 protein [Candidatus Levybacteria bacterium]
MKIAIDVSPIEDKNKLAHRVRGTGFYISHLKEALLEYYSRNQYVFFSDTSELSGDIDITHYPYFEPFFLTLPVFSGNKRVVTVHDLTPLVFPKEFPSGIKGKIRWQIQKLALKKAGAIIADSQSSKRDIVKYTGIEESKIQVIYLAAGSEFIRIQKSETRIQSLKNKYKLPDKFALYVGDATWNKNLPSLIRACSKINVPLVMVGKALVDRHFDQSNPWNKDLVEINKLADDNKKVIRLGFVPTEDLVSIYNVATVLTMPSLYEGFGLPILEAMSCGCPVIASRGGSLPEVVGVAGNYVDPYDVDSIAKGISEVFNNQILQKELSQKGITQSKKFTWRDTADKTMDVYRKVVA